MKRSGKASKLPPKIAAMAPEDRPTIDEERWLPKQQRTDYVDPRKSREEEKRRKQKEKLSTQGSSAQNAVQSQNTGGSGGASRKKGKGKKH